MDTKPSEPVLVIMSVLAALQALVAGAAWTEYLPPAAAHISALIVAALTAGMAFYVRGRVTPMNGGKSPE